MKMCLFTEWQNTLFTTLTALMNDVRAMFLNHPEASFHGVNSNASVPPQNGELNQNCLENLLCDRSQFSPTIVEASTVPKSTT
jgi:hypothetical protein